jgi:hypothetical protein
MIEEAVGGIAAGVLFLAAMRAMDWRARRRKPKPQITLRITYDAKTDALYYEVLRGPWPPRKGEQGSVVWEDRAREKVLGTAGD